VVADFSRLLAPVVRPAVLVVIHLLHIVSFLHTCQPSQRGKRTSISLLRWRPFWSSENRGKWIIEGKPNTIDATMDFSYWATELCQHLSQTFLGQILANRPEGNSDILRNWLWDSHRCSRWRRSKRPAPRLARPEPRPQD
jgi:hypothetical protein